VPLALTIIGIMLIISGARDTYADLGNTLAGDFTGKNTTGAPVSAFTARAAAIGMIGMIGLAGENFRRLSTGMLVLMTVALLISTDKGFFANLAAAMKSGPVKPTAAPAAPPTSGSGSPGAGSQTSPQDSRGAPPATALSTGMNALKLGLSLLPIF